MNNLNVQKAEQIYKSAEPTSAHQELWERDHKQVDPAQKMRLGPRKEQQAYNCERTVGTTFASRTYALFVMAPQGQLYTLCGFSQELDWRPLHFVQRIPAHRICKACGVLPRVTVFLPCRHVLCKSCYEQCLLDDGCACLLDSDQFLSEEAEWRDFPLENPLKWKSKATTKTKPLWWFATEDKDSDMEFRPRTDRAPHSRQERRRPLEARRQGSHWHGAPLKMIREKQAAFENVLANAIRLAQEGHNSNNLDGDSLTRSQHKHCQMASGPRQSGMATSEHQFTDGGVQREFLASVADSRGFVPFFDDPFKQGLVLSGGSMVALQKVHPPSVQLFPPQSRAACLEAASSYCPSPSESSTLQGIGGLSDVRMLSPAFPSDSDRWSQRSISRLFSHSTGGEEFDQASLSNHMSSVAEEGSQRGQPLSWARYNKLVAFLAAAAVVCISAVMVDMTWTILSHGNTRQLLGEARSPPGTEPTERAALHQYAPMLKWPPETEEKPLPKATPTFLNPDSEATVYREEVETPPVQVMVITQSPNKAATKKHAREPPRVTPYLPRLSTWKRRRTFTRRRAAAARRHRDIDAGSNRRAAPMRRPVSR
ncbi:hypothetical protein HPB49_002044 [Dermacentor silvarum]|uniref:Uncharacterized protein n=1 Tax=Dermacentor silvarum TaxID=543639 RepID=A0ACB8C1X3_DERSI|nr:hypothetical protein HPB49_002044 [Dermacentor silvarum]